MNNILPDIDFKTIKNDPNFKEDSVREVVIVPLLKQLGYQQEKIERSKTLKHPFLKIGSKKRKIDLIPDYVLKVCDRYAWVLDAKSPNENIKEGDNIEQVYSYATHPEIRSNYFALCNGLEFSLFKTLGTDSPILYFNLDEIDYYWSSLTQYLSPVRFQVGENFTYELTNATAKPKGNFDYKNRPLLEPIKVRKQQAKRHFGVHAYFTRQSWNLELGFLDLLAKEYSDLTPILLENFDYDENNQLYTIKKNTKFKSQIDVKLRIKYYLISYLRRMEKEHKNPSFDEIVLNILPLLKNGTTPENQTILTVLEDIAERIGDNSWRLKREGQLSLF